MVIVQKINDNKFDYWKRNLAKKKRKKNVNIFALTLNVVMDVIEKSYLESFAY